MNNQIELVEAVFQRMQQVGFVASKSEFSVKLLEKSPSYLTSMRARDRYIRDDIVKVLADNMQWAMAEEAGEVDALKSELARRELMFDHLQDLLEYVRIRTYSQEAIANVSDSSKEKNLFLKWLPYWLFSGNRKSKIAIQN